MPQPAPARFDASSRRAVVATLLAATGPTLALGSLIGVYALSARECAPHVRWVIAGCIALGALVTLGSAGLLARAPTGPEPRAVRPLRPAAIGLQLFCVLVMVGFGIALATVAPCD